MAALLAVAACRPRTIIVDGMLSDAGNTPECPHTWRLKRPDVMEYLPGTRTNVPEFHDCQKLRDSLEHYGPLAAVFAKDSLESVQDSTLATPSGRALALVYLPDGPSGGDYAPLGLTKQWACVIVRRTPQVEGAWIVPLDDGAVCSSPVPPGGTATSVPLDLHVMAPPAGMNPSDIPPVARWDWDELTNTQYIGVRCGSAWCEVGVKGFQSSASHDPGSGTSEERAGYALRGAYDEQKLAEFPDKVLTPAMNLGTVVPLPELDAFNTATAPQAGKWVPVARTHLAPSAGTYDKKFNFASTATVTPTEASASTVSLCVWTETTACRASERFTKLDVSRCTKDPSGARWISRVDRPGAGSRYFCVLYRQHTPGFHVPPVVRWRWRADDETIWISCPSGCCEVRAKG